MKVMTAVFACLAAASFGTLTAFAADPPVDSKAVADKVDQILRRTRENLEFSAGTVEVKAATWDGMKTALANIQSELKGVVWFALPNGSYYTVDKGLVSQKIDDRPYFSRVMGGESSVGDIVTSKSTGRPVVVVAVPVKGDNGVIGVLGASLYLDELSKRIDGDLKLPPTTTFLAVSRDGKVALSRDAAQLMTDQKAAAGPDVTTSPLSGWTFSLAKP